MTQAVEQPLVYPPVDEQVEDDDGDEGEEEDEQPNTSDIAQRVVATLEAVRSACDRLVTNLARTDRLASADTTKIGDELHRFGSWCVEVAEHLATSANIPSPWESDTARAAMRKRRGLVTDAEPIETADAPSTEQWVRLNVWIKHNAELRAAGHVPAAIERAYWQLYGLLDEHFPDGDTLVCPVSRRQLGEGATESEVFCITIDTGSCRFDVDARDVDMQMAFVSGLLGIADRNIRAANAIDQAAGEEGGAA